MSKEERSNNLSCLRCGGRMVHIFTEHIQLGKASLVLGSWPNLTAGAMLAAVYCCQDCRRLELFAADDPELREDLPAGDLPQVTCPVCGKSHDFDYPRCPCCGHRYET